jgi:hypothetical protein
MSLEFLEEEGTEYFEYGENLEDEHSDYEEEMESPVLRTIEDFYRENPNKYYRYKIRDILILQQDKLGREHPEYAKHVIKHLESSPSIQEELFTRKFGPIGGLPPIPPVPPTPPLPPQPIIILTMDRLGREHYIDRKTGRYVSLPSVEYHYREFVVPREGVPTHG